MILCIMEEQNHGCCENWSARESLEEMDFRRSLCAAAQRNDIRRIRELIERGGHVDGEDLSGYTPLLYAARHGHLDACILLLENGANVNRCTRAGKSTSLHRAAHAGHTEVVKALLKAGADPLIKDAEGLTPIQKAEAQSHLQIVKFLRDESRKQLENHDLNVEGDQHERSMVQLS